jgi:hypothetical protein
MKEFSQLLLYVYLLDKNLFKIACLLFSELGFLVSLFAKVMVDVLVLLELVLYYSSGFVWLEIVRNVWVSAFLPFLPFPLLEFE